MSEENQHLAAASNKRPQGNLHGEQTPTEEQIKSNDLKKEIQSYLKGDKECLTPEEKKQIAKKFGFGQSVGREAVADAADILGGFVGLGGIGTAGRVAMDAKNVTQLMAVPECGPNGEILKAPKTPIQNIQENGVCVKVMGIPVGGCR